MSVSPNHMENFITVAIIIVVVLYNLITNYMKEQQKNHDRKRSKNKSIITENFPPIIPLFQKKEEKPISFDKENNYELDDFSNKKYTSDEMSYHSSLPDSKNKNYNNITDSQKSDLDNLASVLNQSSYLENNLTSSYTSYLAQASPNSASKSEIEEQYEKDRSINGAIELNLNSPDDYKKAFIYSLIFERKY